MEVTSKTKRVHYRFFIYLVVTILLYGAMQQLVAGYNMLKIVGSLAYGSVIVFFMEYILSYKIKDMFRYYFIIISLCIVAMLPMLLNGFFYGDDYWGINKGSATDQIIITGLGFSRPLVGLIQCVFTNITTETSYKFRAVNVAVIALFGCLLFRFIYERTQKAKLPMILTLGVICSVVAVDCVAYLSVFPIIYSLLLTFIAYLSYRKGAENCQCGERGHALLDFSVSLLSLYAAFCLYQIGTPLFFVLFMIDEYFRNQAKGFFKRGICLVTSYGVVAIIYLVGATAFRTLYQVTLFQEGRSAFITTFPEIQAKITWFATMVIPEAFGRICAMFLGQNAFTTNCLFYGLSFRNAYIGRLLTLFVGVMVLVFIISLVKQKRYFFAFMSICLIPASFYPFLILPESYSMTYYTIPMIIILLFYCLSGISAVASFLTSCFVWRYSNVIKKIICGMAAMLIVLNGAVYANFWSTYCSDNYKYIKQSIINQINEQTERIHVNGVLSPYVGGKPYVVHCVNRVLESIGEETSKYKVTQCDTDYYMSYLSPEDAALIESKLDVVDYVKFISHYMYSELYVYYSFCVMPNSIEDKRFLADCLAKAGLVLTEPNPTAIVIDMTAFHQTHSF